MKCNENELTVQAVEQETGSERATISPIDGLELATAEQTAKYLGIEAKELRSLRQKYRKELSRAGAETLTGKEVAKRATRAEKTPGGGYLVWLRDGTTTEIHASGRVYYSSKAIAGLDRVLKGKPFEREAPQETPTTGSIAQDNHGIGEIISIQGVDCYEKDGVAYLRLETCARGLGFVDNSKGDEYVKWDRVRKYLSEIGFSTEVSKDAFIPENVFYRLAMKAKNAAAEAFQAKIADEVIPSIRKHGVYIAGQEAMTREQLLAKAWVAVNEILEERDRAIKGLEERITADAPCTNVGKVVVGSEYGISVGQFSNLVSKDGIVIGRNTMFQELRDAGFLQRNNRPMQKYIEKGFFYVKEMIRYGRPCCQTYITGKGQEHLITVFLPMISAKYASR